MDKPQRRRAFSFIVLSLTLDAMGIGLILPVLPDLLAEVNASTIGAAAVWGGILTTSFAVMQFLFGPALGSLSDRFGRRPVLLISLFIMALDYMVMALAQTIWLLLAARIVGGITAATQSTAFAFIADISPPEEKSANFGLVGAAFGEHIADGSVDATGSAAIRPDNGNTFVTRRSRIPALGRAVQGPRHCAGHLAFCRQQRL